MTGSPVEAGEVAGRGEREREREKEREREREREERKERLRKRERGGREWGRGRGALKSAFWQARLSQASVISLLFEARGRDAFLHLLKRKVSSERNTLALLDSLNTAKVCENAAERRPYFLPSFNTERICSEEEEGEETETEEEKKSMYSSKTGDFILVRVFFFRAIRRARNDRESLRCRSILHEFR